MQHNSLRTQPLEMLKRNLQVLGNVPSVWMDLHQVTHGCLQQNHVQGTQRLQH